MITQAIIPPTRPSTVLFGETRGMSAVRPIVEPTNQPTTS